MSNQLQSRHVVTEPGPLGLSSVFARILWIMGGARALFTLAIFIFENKTYSALDAVYWVIAAGLVLIRYIDNAYLTGLTADSEPAARR